MSAIIQRAVSLGWNRSSTSLLAPTSVLASQDRGMAARKGTRARKEAIAKANRLRKLSKMKQEEQKKFSRFDWKKKVVDAPWIADDTNLTHSLDDVYFTNLYVHPRVSFSDAINYHRETHHPTMCNEPNAPVIARLHLDMTTDKSTKFVDKWKGILAFPKVFDTGVSNAVLALCKGEEEQQLAVKGGAALVGGVELIQDIKAGKLDKDEFDYIVAHNDIISELIELRGLLKRKFPNQKMGTLGIDIEHIVRRYCWGLSYEVIKSDENPARGWFDLQIGTLDMELEDLEANISSLINEVLSHPILKKSSPLIAQLHVGSPPSNEWFVLNNEMFSEEPQQEEQSG